MPFTKQLAVNDPAAVFASTIIEQNEVVKAAEALIGPAKKELAALAEGYFYKDLPKVKAEVPSVYVVGATVTTSMPDGTLVVSPAGKDLQVQMKISRKEVSVADADKVMKAVGPEAYDKLLVDALVLESVPMLGALDYAKAHPEFCTVVVADECAVITIKDAKNIPGAKTKAVVMPVEGFLDGVRTLEADTRKLVMPVIKTILTACLGVSIAALGSKADKAKK